MKDIGIRQLKAHASDLVRKVAEEHATYTITRRGRPVGILAPTDFKPPACNEGGDAAWKRFEECLNRIAKSKQSRKSALRELANMRR